jgi:hypothetical protein
MKRLAILLLLTTPVLADPPPGVPIDPEMHEYYHSLKVPAGPFAGGLCCDVADCRNVVVRSDTKDGAYYAYIDSKTYPDDGSYGHGHAPNAWVKVPEQVIIHDRPNLTGEPIACWYKGEIRCFVPASLT